MEKQCRICEFYRVLCFINVEAYRLTSSSLAYTHKNVFDDQISSSVQAYYLLCTVVFRTTKIQLRPSYFDNYGNNVFATNKIMFSRAPNFHNVFFCVTKKCAKYLMFTRKLCGRYKYVD